MLCFHTRAIQQCKNVLLQRRKQLFKCTWKCNYDLQSWYMCTCRRNEMADRDWIAHWILFTASLFYQLHIVHTLQLTTFFSALSFHFHSNLLRCAVLPIRALAVAAFFISCFNFCNEISLSFHHKTTIYLRAHVERSTQNWKWDFVI